MENHFKQGCKIILFGFLCSVLSSSAIEVVTAKEFNTTKEISAQIWNNNIPYSNGLMFVQVDTRNLELNCSIPRSPGRPITIAWRRGQIWLDSRSIKLISNNNGIVLRLKIDHISWDLNGSFFWCGPRDTHLLSQNVKGSSVTIITGDLPRPPVSIHHNIVDLRLFIINVYWKEPSSVGSLPAQYNVTYISCINRTYCQENPRNHFCIVRHVIGKVNYKCSKAREEMKAIGAIRDLYRITVATVNPLGESKSPEFEVDVDLGGSKTPLLPTPLPPLGLNVSVIDSNTIVIRWKPRPFWTHYDDSVTYTVLYHKDNDLANKTVKVQGQTVFTLRKAEPFTRYHIYITVEFLDYSNNESSGTSDVLGPRIIRTPEGEPDQGPDIINVSSIRYPYDTTRRNVTITWEVPPQSSWRGHPSRIKIHNSLRNDLDFQEKVISANPYPPSEAVLTGLDSTAAYMLSIALCNSRNYCGVDGTPKEVPPISGPNGARMPDFKSMNLMYYILIGVCILVAIPATGFIGHCYLKRKSRIIVNQVPLSKMISDLGPGDQAYTDYDDIDRLSSSSEYDTPNQINIDI